MKKYTFASARKQQLLDLGHIEYADGNHEESYSGDLSFLDKYRICFEKTAEDTKLDSEMKASSSGLDEAFKRTSADLARTQSEIMNIMDSLNRIKLR